MRRALLSSVVVLVLGMYASAEAQCCKSSASKATAQSSSKCSTAKACLGTSGGSAACDGQMACSGPKMWYKVAGERLCCPNNAEILAKAHNTQVRYVVGGSEYECKDSAMAAYKEALESALSQATRVQYAVGDDCVSCPMAAKRMAESCNREVKFRVASWTFEQREEADVAATKARHAADAVSMVALVDGKEYGCPASASMAAKNCGSKCVYRVGKSETPCEKTAEIMLAEARLNAAWEAIASTRTGA